MTAVRASESARPAQPLKVVQAVVVSAEPGKELAGRSRVVGARDWCRHATSLVRLSGYPRPGLSDRYRAVPEHGQGLCPRSEGLAAALLRPRRARPARAPDPPPMAARFRDQFARCGHLGHLAVDGRRRSRQYTPKLRSWKGLSPAAPRPAATGHPTPFSRSSRSCNPKRPTPDCAAPAPENGALASRFHFQAMPVLRRDDTHRCPRADVTTSVAMPKFIPALNVLTPRLLFRVVAAREVTASLMWLATTAPSGPLARLSEARFRSKIGCDRPRTFAVSRFVLVLMTKVLSATLLPLWLKISP